MKSDRTLEKLAAGVELASKATPGPWALTEYSTVVGPDGRLIDYEDAAFIAHWNPEFVLEVAREVERLRRVEEAASHALVKIKRTVAVERADGWYVLEPGGGTDRKVFAIAEATLEAVTNSAAKDSA